MKIILILLCLVSFAGAQTKSIEVKITGTNYNKLLNKWLEHDIYVYVDSGANTYIATNAGLKASAIVTKAIYKQLMETLEKAVKWHGIAKDKELETTKVLADFQYKDGISMKGVKMTFFTAKKGKQTNLILDIIDFDNPFKKSNLYLDLENTKKLLEAVKAVPETYKKLLKNEKDADALQ